MNSLRAIPLFALLALASATGCKSDQYAATDANASTSGARTNRTNGNGNSYASVALPSGSAVDVTLGNTLTSETANVGDPWSGVLTSPVVVEGHTLAPAGSRAGGTVSGVMAAKRGDRAMLDIGLGWFSAGGKDYQVRGRTPSVVAGSTRARNLGAIAAATAVGAVAGHAIGGSTKGTIIGAVVGAGAAAGVVSQTRGWQVVLKPGMAFTFNTSEVVAVRL